MELKEAILATLAELQHDEDPPHLRPASSPEQLPLRSQPQPLMPPKEELLHEIAQAQDEEDAQGDKSALAPLQEDQRFYLSLKERILVLFEGMQSPNNRNVEAKVDLTLNFLEYLLSVLDEKLDKKR